MGRPWDLDLNCGHPEEQQQHSSTENSSPSALKGPSEAVQSSASQAGVSESLGGTIKKYRFSGLPLENLIQ